MASSGSLPFAIDTAIETSLLHNRNYRRPNLPLFAYRPRKSLDSCGLNELTFKCSKIGNEDILGCSLCCDRVMGGRTRRIKSLKAKGKGSGEVEDGGDESEDALQATIEKSKKVLAMQRDLLQQVLSSSLTILSITMLPNQ